METIGPSSLESMVSRGSVRHPAEYGMADVVPDLADDVASLSDLVTADRDRERNR